MAAKIKEGLWDITHGVVERFKGGPKYADNLLGESLQDQLRKATAKELIGPSEELISQIIDTINQDVANGKESREIMVLLKKRLRTDNPHKQWLSVLLIGRVMHDCAASLGTHQEELLQEVARVMTRPAKRDSSAGASTRKAAKELLRSYGRAGTSAFRAVARSTIADASTAAQIAASAESRKTSPAEAATLVKEVSTLIEQAKANTELLNEMLVADPGQGGAAGSSKPPPAQAGAAGLFAGDEFESELTLELVTDVRELRSVFDMYLEQLQMHSGDSRVESILIRALEAVDLLDGALALHKDVASNQREIEQQATEGRVLRSPVNSAITAVPSSNADLISLDDFGGLLPAPPPVLAGDPGAPPPPEALAAAAEVASGRSAPSDPFATLDPISVHSTLYSSSAQPQSITPSQLPMTAGAVSGQSHYSSNPYVAYPPFQQQYYQQHQQPYGVLYAQPAVLYGGVSATSPAAPLNHNHLGSTSGTQSLLFGPTSQPAAAAAATIATPAAISNSGNNPFAYFAPQVAPAASSNAATIDNEWALFFANRTAGAAAAPQQR